MGSTLSESGTGGDAAVKSRLNELAQKFVTRTTGDLALMREGLSRLEAGDRAGLDQIRHLAHRACGTGGTLGLCALSDAAGEFEALLAQRRPGDEQHRRLAGTQRARGVLHGVFAHFRSFWRGRHRRRARAFVPRGVAGKDQRRDLPGRRHRGRDGGGAVGRDGHGGR